MSGSPSVVVVHADRVPVVNRIFEWADFGPQETRIDTWFEPSSLSDLGTS